MHLCCVGINQDSAPLALRERVAYKDESRARALAALRAFCSEAVILDTCGRSEVYALGAADSTPRLQQFLCDFHLVSADALHAHLYMHADQDAITHLFAVASGIDSLVIGEAQILAQVRSAFETAQQQGACGPVLSALFREAVRVGKRARSETRIAQGALSLSSVAIERARIALGSLQDRRALLIGAGKMSALAAKHLRALGVQSLWVASRTFAHAEELAEAFACEAVPFEQVPHYLAQSDVVFTSTAAPHILLTYEMVAVATRARAQPLCIIDLALPRDVEPRVADLPRVELIDLDSLKVTVEQNFAQRHAEVCKVELIIAEEVRAFEAWLHALRVTPTVAALRQRAEQIRQSELADHLGRLQNLSAHDKRVIESMTASIVGRLLHEPTLRLKARAHHGDGAQYAAMLRELFALDGDT